MNYILHMHYYICAWCAWSAYRYKCAWLWFWCRVLCLLWIYVVSWGYSCLIVSCFACCGSVLFHSLCLFGLTGLVMKIRFGYGRLLRVSVGKLGLFNPKVSLTTAISSGIGIRVSFGSLQASYALRIWRAFTRGMDRQVGLQTLKWASSLKAGSWMSSHNGQGPHVRSELGNGRRRCPHIARRGFSWASSEQSFQQAGGVGCNRDHHHMGCSQGVTSTQKEAWPWQLLSLW